MRIGYVGTIPQVQNLPTGKDKIKCDSSACSSGTKKVQKGKPPPAPPSGKKKKKLANGIVRCPQVSFKDTQDLRLHTIAPQMYINNAERLDQVVDLYQELRKSELKTSFGAHRAPRAAGANSGSESLFEELKKMSKYLQSIQDDVRTHGSTIKQLIIEVESLRPKCMESLAAFVSSTDEALDKLTDETAVLKRFEWPGKYFTFREACALRKEIKGMKESFTLWTRPAYTSAAEELRKIEEKLVSQSYLVVVA